MRNDNYRFPEIMGEVRAFWLIGQTGGQQMVCDIFGHYSEDFYADNKEPIHCLLEIDAVIDFEIELN